MPRSELTGVVDFRQRVEPADLPEWLDEPCTYEQLKTYLADLQQVNTLTFAARPTLHWLAQVARSHKGRTLRIVDIGCGGGDMLRRIERWARRRKIAVHLVGIDLNPHAAQVARSLDAPDSRIEWITGDAFSYTGHADVILSALFTHHLSTPEVVRFLEWMEATARSGWFINDLCRERVPYTLFSLVAALAGWHKLVRHDGPVSFRRSFREADWLAMFAAAGVPAESCMLQRWRPGRLCVGRIKPV